MKCEVPVPVAVAVPILPVSELSDMTLIQTLVPMIPPPKGLEGC